jgi:hypothetical protein
MLTAALVFTLTLLASGDPPMAMDRRVRLSATSGLDAAPVESGDGVRMECDCADVAGITMHHNARSTQ